MELTKLLDDIMKSNEIKQAEEAEKAKEVAEKDCKYKSYPVDKISEVTSYPECLDIIKKAGFEIVNYKKLIQYPAYYCDFIEVYLLKYRCWMFEVNIIEDDDIEEGIFAVYSIKNVNTSEEIKNYLDIGCRNTTKMKYNRFMQQLECDSLDEYMEKYFKEYKLLPEYLQQEGLSIDDKEYNIYDVIKQGSYFGCGNYYISVYPSIYNEIMIAITNIKGWNCQCYNSSADKKECAYYVRDYKGRESIPTILNMLSLFDEEMTGKIGFLYNNEYFSNASLEKYFRLLQRQISYNDYNHYHIQMDVMKFYDGRGYSEKNNIPSKLTGREVYFVMEFSFNDAAQWSNGDTALKLVFEIIYDKNISNNMILNTYGYKFSNIDGTFAFKSEEAEEKYHEDTTFSQNDWEFAALDFNETTQYTCPDNLMGYINNLLAKTSDSFGILHCFGTNDVYDVYKNEE